MSDGELQLFGLSESKQKFDNLLTELTELSSTVRSGASSFNNVGAKAETLVDSATGVLTNSLDSYLKSSDQFMQHLNSGFSQVPAAVSFFERLKRNGPMLTLNLYALSRSNDIHSAMLPLANVAHNLGLDEYFTTKITSWFQKRDEGTKQFSENSQKLFLFGLSMLTSLTPSSIMGKLKLSNNLKEMQAMNSMIEMFSDLLAEWGFDVKSKTRELMKLREQLATIITDLPDFETALNLQQTKFLKHSYYDKFCKLKDLVEEMRKDVCSNAYTNIRDSTFTVELMDVSRRVRKIAERVEMIRKNQQTRQLPAWFLFHGATKIGKTKLILHLFDQIINTQRTGPYFEGFADYKVWNANSSDKFNQGYFGQPLHHQDDEFTRADQEDHADTINMISESPYLTRQADISEKGQPYLAEAKLSSCNHCPHQSKTIFNLEALYSRANIVVCYGPPQKPQTTLDSSFPGMTFYLVPGTEYRALLKGKSTTADEADVKAAYPSVTVPQILDTILDTMEFNNISYMNSLPSLEANDDAVYLEEDEYDDAIDYFEEPTMLPRDYDKTFKVFSPLTNSEDFTRFIVELKQLDYNLYLKLRMAKISNGQTQLRIIEYLNRLMDKSTLHALILCARNGTLPEAKNPIYFSQRNFTYVWKGKNILRTTYKPNPRVPVMPFAFSEADLRPTFWNEMKLGFCRFYQNTWMALRPFISYVASGTYFTCLMTKNWLYAAMCVISSWLAVLCMKQDVSQQSDHFYNMFLIISSDVATLALVSYVLFQFGTALGRIYTNYNIKSYCPQCLDNVHEHDKFKSVRRICALNCKDDHTHDCYDFNTMTKTECDACEKGLCTSSCFHKRSIVDEAKVTKKFEDLIELYDEVFEKEASGDQAKKKAPRKTRSFGKRKQAAEIYAPIKPLADKLPLFVTKEGVGIAVDAESMVELEEETPCEAEAIVGYTPNGATPAAVKPKTNKVKFSMFESCIDENAKNTLVSLTQLTVRVVRTNSNGSMAFLHGIGYDRYVICPQHIKANGPGNTYHMVIKDVEIPLEFYSEETSLELALFHIPNGRHVFKTTVMKHLMTNDQYSYKMNIEKHGYQYIPTSSEFGLIQPVLITYRSEPMTMQLTEGLFSIGKSLAIRATQTSSPITSKGDCGGFIVLEDTSAEKKLVGMHIIGSGKQAYSCVVTSDILKDLLNKKSASLECLELGPTKEYPIVETEGSEFPIVDIENVLDYVVEVPPYLPPGNFEYLGEIPYDKPVKITQLRKHPFKKNFKCKVAPACLSHEQVPEEYKTNIPLNAKGIPDLMLMKTSKYGQEDHELSPRHLAILEGMKEELIEHYVEVFANENIGPCSISEAIGGHPDDPFSHPLDPATSSGLGWSKFGKSMSLKKGRYFERLPSGEWAISTEPHGIRLTEILKETERLGGMGVRTLSIDKNCLKDETRPLDKIWKPRLFKARPIDKVLLKRKYFLNYKIAWTKMKTRLCHGVGINPFSTDWNDAYYHLLSKGNNGFCADFGGFDTNQLRVFQYALKEVKIETIKQVCMNQGKPLTNQEISMMHVLLDESINSISASYSTVYMDHHGNSSGDPDTTEDNTELNKFYHWFAYILITGKTSWACFAHDVSSLFFGDDLAITARTGTGYTFENVQKIMTDVLHQDYTTAFKEKVGHDMPISEMTFLKRQFKYVSPSIIHAPLEKESIESRFCWTNLRNTDFTGHATLIYEGLMEASLHDADYYVSLRKKLRAGLSSTGWNAISVFEGCTPNHSDMKMLFLERFKGGSS